MVFSIEVFYRFLATVFLQVLLMTSASAQIPNLKDFKRPKENEKPVIKEFNCKINKDDFVPGEILVKYKSNSPNKYRSLKLKNSRNKYLGKKLISKAYDKSLENLYRYQLPQESKKFLVTQDAFLNCLEIQQLIKKLKENPNIEIAEPNFIYHSTANFNDPLLNEVLKPPGLWGHKKIEVESAWDLAQGYKVSIAVIDSGLDFLHPDIVKNVPFLGGDFIDYDTIPNDITGHGTHVAGTIGASGNNKQGIIGIAFQSKIFPIKILDGFGQGGLSYSSNVIQALNQAAVNGVKVVNMSFGGGNYSLLLEQACNSLFNSGIALIAASGNNSTNELSYPAGYTSVLSVGASDENDQLSSFSNYGTWVDVVAPGENILSLFSQNSLDICNFIGSPVCTYDKRYMDNSVYGYAVNRGTSMASPHVSGLAALLFSYDDKLSADEVYSIIQINTDPIDTSKEIGGGRINAKKALKYAQLFKAFRTSDANLDFTISDDETLRLSYNLYLNFYRSYNRAYDLDNNYKVNYSDWQIFQKVIFTDNFPALEKNYINYYKIFRSLDKEKPYGRITKREVANLRNQFKNLIRRKKYSSYLDFNSDGRISFHDYDFAIYTINRL